MAGTRIDDEQERQKNRIHKLADTVQANQITLAEQSALIGMLQQQIDAVHGTFVNRDLLNATVGTALMKVENLHNENKLKFEHFETKLDHLHSDLAPIRRAIYWAASLIVGAVILALVALVVRGGPIQ
jgi:hypothetical protein